MALLVLLLIAGSSQVQAQEQQPVDCTTALETAEGHYFAARFDAAITLIETCLERRAFDTDEQQQAYTLLGQSYFAKRQEEQARAAVRALLDLLPDYEPGPELRPSFRQLVEEIKASMQEEEEEPASAAEPAPRRRRTWLWVGGGAVLAGAATAAVLALSGGNGNGGETAGFPPPPGRPN